MPLPPAAPRRPMHERRIAMHGYEREDGLFDIEGRVTDLKPCEFPITVGATVPPGQPIHDMWVRLTIDDGLTVRDVAATTDAAPYFDCREGAQAMQRMIGVRIGAGWSNEVRQRLGRTQGCTHLMELLIPLGTAAIQSLSLLLRARPVPRRADGTPVQVDSCLALARDREVVLIRFPEHYTGPVPTRP